MAIVDIKFIYAVTKVPHPSTGGIFDTVQWPQGGHCRDYFWLSQDFASYEINANADSTASLSDHQPIILEIKASTANEWLVQHEIERSQAMFIGDSPNDDSRFSDFDHTVGVANIKPFIDELNSPPCYITQHSGG